MISKLPWATDHRSRVTAPTAQGDVGTLTILATGNGSHVADNGHFLCQRRGDGDERSGE